MEKIEDNIKSVEYYDDLLTIKLVGIDKIDLGFPLTYVFSVTPNYNIFISDVSHEYLAEKYGVDLDRTFTEGYIVVNKGGKFTVKFKSYNYQPVPGFDDSTENLFLLQQAVRNKILNIVK